MKKIELVFPKTITRLAGNDYGRQVFQDQVKNYIDYDVATEIVFPTQIIMIASSFVQGFFDEIINNVGLLGIGRSVFITAPNIDIEEKIIKNLR